MRTLKSWLLMALSCPFILGATMHDSQTKDSMLTQLDLMRHVFQVRYAPADWKKRQCGWDLDDEISKAKEQVKEAPTLSLKEYQRILQRFFNRVGDYHVGVSFFSTEAADLPFAVVGAEGSYFISAIDRERLAQRSFGFDVGDELVSFDGKPTGEVIKALAASDLANTGTPTDYALAEMLLTSRSASRGHVVPRGPVSITLKSHRTGQLSSFQIIWEYTPEKIKALSPTLVKQTPSVESLVAQGRLLDHPFFKKQMVTPLWAAKEMKARANFCHPNDLGARESFIPRLGQVLWETDKENPFDAYIFRHPNSGQSIGYVRIPHYSAGEDEAKEFRNIIATLQAHTDALVIDQVNNPGGSAFYLYALASMLNDQPMYTPRHRMTLTQQDVSFALCALPMLEEIRTDDEAREVLGDTYDGYPVTYQFSQFLLQFFRFLIDEWDAGRCLTTPYYLEGVDNINPDVDVRYTKPILMLINRLDFSGGDFLAAILKDNHRVTLFGECTAGAGGYVEGFSHPNSFGICFVHYTASLAERTVGCPIETLGVSPDIPYKLTRQDVENGYQEYARAVLDAVTDLVKKKR